MINEISSRIDERYPTIQSYFSKTQLYPSSISPHLLIKAENNQYTGSFKIRGASSKLTQLKKERQTSVITASTGNHALAIATIADKLEISVQVFVPESISPAKEEKLLRYPVNLTKVPGDPDKVELAARQKSEEQEIPFASPYNDQDIIIGQGSIAIELAQQTDLMNVGRVYVTVGGGGLISGIGSYLTSVAPHIEVVGCQPTNSAAMFYSHKAGQIVEIEHQPTLSDGSAGGIEPGSITFPIAQEVVDRYVIVSEEEIKEAIYQAFIHHHAIIEGSAGVALAAFLKDETEGQKNGNKDSIVIWTGGNIDLTLWKSVINEYNLD